MRQITLMFLLLLFTTCSNKAKAQTKRLPDMKIQQLDLNWVNTKNICDSNDLTIVAFWATWCKYCITELNSIDALYPTWQKQYNVKLYAVNIDVADDLTRVKNKVIQTNWKYEILLDNEMLLTEAMKMDNPPYTYLLNRNGEVLWEHNGYSPGDELILQEKIREFYKPIKNATVPGSTIK